MLVFSLAAIDFVKVKIDDGDWINCEQKELPLFVAKWNPLQYLDGLHKIQVNLIPIKTVCYNFKIQFPRFTSKT